MILKKQTKPGVVAIESDGVCITRLSIEGESDLQSPEGETCPAIDRAFEELELYLDGKLKEFTVLLKPEGTAFMKKVWSRLLKIPYGKTATYKEIAIDCGNSKAVRAVGLANNKNPIPIFIPCHRVIGSGGRIAGYSGGAKNKILLLKIEGAIR